MERERKGSAARLLADTAMCRGRGWSCKPQKTVLTADYYVSESLVTDGFAPVEPPQEMSPAEEAELNRPLEGTPEVWPPRGTYEPVDGPTDGPQVDGDMCEDETPAPLEAGEAEVEERGESSSHEQMLEEEESESAEPDDPSTTGASQTHTHGNTGGREHNTELEIPSSPEVCPTVRSVEKCQVYWQLAPGVTVTQACVGHWFAMTWGDIGGSALALRSPGAWRAVSSVRLRVDGLTITGILH